MPKNPLKTFGRRRSSGNVLDIAAEGTPPATSSFRVLERPEKQSSPAGNSNGSLRPQPRANQARPFQSPLANLRGRSAEELGPGLNRGSGGTTNSGSSGYYDSSSQSARHSSSSTLPSSVEVDREREEEELFPRKSNTTPMFHSHTTPVDESFAPPPSFTSRAARALSFGQKQNRIGPQNENSLPPLPAGPPRSPERSHSPSHRSRAETTSSYASTAVPAKPDRKLNLSNTDFGSDFGSMFDKPNNGLQENVLPSPPPPPVIGGFHRTESEPMYPPRSHSRQALTPSPNQLRAARDDASSPYSWDGRQSEEGFMSSSALSSPKTDVGPNFANGLAPSFLGGAKTGYSRVPERYSSPGLERTSPGSQHGSSNKDTEDKDEYSSIPSQSDEEEKWVKRVELRDPQQPASASSLSYLDSSKPVASRKPLPLQAQANAGASRADHMSPRSPESSGPAWASESRNATPKASKLSIPEQDELFDISPKVSPSRAIRPGSQVASGSGDVRKKMTKAEFERLQRYGDDGGEHEEGEEQSGDEEDDEDEAERAKNVARQRRKQEANMAVYRQQMKKVTGGGPTDLPSAARPSLDRASMSAPAAASTSLHLGGMGGRPPSDTIRGKATNEEDDDDVPLGILQAHGFPSATRPPTHAADHDANGQRRVSGAGSVVGGGAGQGNLPPFARRLPQDPYFGASLINQTNRESLAFNASQHSHYAPPQMPHIIPQQGNASSMMAQQQQMMMQQPQMGHPGGLVGVIAGEERAKAARRGSPNPATGMYGNGGMALPGNMQGQMGPMPNMARTMSMGTVMAPQVYTPSGLGSNPMMPPMPPMPMPQVPMMPPMQSSQMQNPQQDQMQQWMVMQMQVMQNMLAMQQQQMGQSPQPQQQTPDYLSVPPTMQRPASMASQMSSFPTPLASQGRAMTMVNPPPRWDTMPSSIRPNSAMPASYAPSTQGLTVSGGGPGPGYTPSIAPSERSNVGQPSRYRPITMDGTGRSQSMTSSMTLQALGNARQPTPEMLTPTGQTRSKNTIRIVDKPKGTPKVAARPVVTDEDEEEGWAEMRKKREDKKKKTRFGKPSTDEGTALSELYQTYE